MNKGDDLLKRKYRKIYKKCMAGILVGSMLWAAPVIAAPVDEAPGSDVYLDVIRYDRQKRVSVTVPTTFAFVVNGTQGGSTASISVSNGTLLLPNVTVRVNDPTSSTSSYDVEVSQTADMYVRNYSTQLTIPDVSGKQEREGLALFLNAYLENQGDTSLERSYWEASATSPSTAGTDFKKYYLKLSTDKGTTWHAFSQTVPTQTNKIWLDTPLPLKAPNAKQGVDTDSKLANVPAVTSLDIDLQVGGQRKDYSQVEQSVKAGTVIWNVVLPQD